MRVLLDQVVREVALAPNELLERALECVDVPEKVGRKQVVILDARGRPQRLERSGLAPLVLGYDDHGRLVHATQGERTFSLTYGVDGLGSSLVDPLSRRYGFSHDRAGRLSAVTGYDFDDDGLLIQAGRLSISRHPATGLVSATSLSTTAGAAIGQGGHWRVDPHGNMTPK